MGIPIYFSYQVPNFEHMNTIGERIREKRKAAGLNQKQLAKAVGVDQSVVSDIENGAGFSAAVLMGLCEALGTTPEYIMRGAAVEDAGGAEMASIFRTLDATQREMLLTMARPLAATKSK